MCVLTGPADGAAQEPTRKYGTNTATLQHLRDWLKSCGGTQVARESTGAYGKPIFPVLEEVEGLPVVLANSRQVRNLRGHQTDPMIVAGWGPCCGTE